VIWASGLKRRQGAFSEVLAMRFTHLTFDCYGTLIDWRNGIESHLGELLRKNGLAPAVKVYPIYLKLEAEEEGKYKSYKDILADTAIRAADHFRISLTREEARGFAASVPSWTPFVDTLESLRQMGERGYKRVILSNVDRDLLRSTIAQNRLEVDGFVTAEDVGSYKPALGHWNRFFDEYKATRDGTLHVAQSVYHDIRPASRIGLATAWINRYSDAKPSDVDPTFVTPDLRGLLKALG
jgi:2-haloalkanoic acid dehalogenase type II